MLNLDSRIDRAQRLLRMLEEDAPLLAVRVADLAPEHQQSAKNYAARLAAHARAELATMMEQRTSWDSDDIIPEPAD
jgi:hypothetical protein